jgi:hypothetical protein
MSLSRVSLAGGQSTSGGVQLQAPVPNANTAQASGSKRRCFRWEEEHHAHRHSTSQRRWPLSVLSIRVRINATLKNARITGSGAAGYTSSRLGSRLSVSCIPLPPSGSAQIRQDPQSVLALSWCWSQSWRSAGAGHKLYTASVSAWGTQRASACRQAVTVQPGVRCQDAGTRGSGVSATRTVHCHFQVLFGVLGVGHGQEQLVVGTRHHLTTHASVSAGRDLIHLRCYGEYPLSWLVCPSCVRQWRRGGKHLRVRAQDLEQLQLAPVLLPHLRAWRCVTKPLQTQAPATDRIAA